MIKRSQIEICHIDKTPLELEPLLKLVQKYAKNLKKTVYISFNNRPKENYGFYDFDKKRNRHRIDICLKKCCKEKTGFPIEVGAQKYLLLSTLIHELYHANQQEKMGQKRFWGDKYGKRKGITDSEWSEYYSICEVEARIYENKNVYAAVEFYDNCCH